MRRIGPATAAVLAISMITPPASAVTDNALREVTGERVLFGHQSVGWNIIDGMNALYATRGITAPDVVDELPTGGPAFAQIEIGSNGDPASKFADFESAVNSGDPQVAAMKLCYVDITAGTKARTVFNQYREMVAGLQSQSPQTRLVHMTVPLTVNDHASNVVRQRYNTLLRRTYGGDVVDIALVESTRPNGSRVTGRLHGKRYYALFRGYAADDGHLNSRGSKRLAKVFLRELA